MGKYDEDPDVLDAFPAQRLLFVATEWPAARKQKWIDKWTSAGGRIVKGDLVALKNDPVWRRMTGRKKWTPPFDREGLVDAEDVPREDAERLGLIKASEELDISAFRDDAPRRLTQPVGSRQQRKAKGTRRTPTKGNGCLVSLLFLITGLLSLVVMVMR